MHFSIHRPTALNPLCFNILDSAFSVSNYIDSFPHIFTEKSAAFVVVASDERRRIVGLCAVDTEVWTEPSFIRGACVGSVAVHPEEQGKGIGRALIRWVTEFLSEQRLHDFVYLFSDKPTFYESVGFTRVGIERIYSLRSGRVGASTQEALKLIGPMEISELDEQHQRCLWQAYERGRRAGESLSSWTKFACVARMKNLSALWVEDQGGKLRAGAFLGKGIDFQGVVHSLWAESEPALGSLFYQLGEQYPALKQNLLIAPGLWEGVLKTCLQLKSTQPLCLVAALERPLAEVRTLFSSATLYPRSLFSS